MEGILLILEEVLFIEINVFGVVYKPFYLLVISFSIGLLVYLIKGGK